MKRCCSCKKQKSLEDFYRSSRTKDSRQTQCIECDRVRKKLSSERLRDREYHQKNKKKRNAYFRAYRSENKLAIYAKRKSYFQKYRRENAERISAYMEEYYSRPSVLIRRKEKKARRRATEEDQADGTLTSKNLKVMARFQNYQCKHCPATLFQSKGDTHLDHILPLSAGGRNSIFNVQWLCANCNLKKGSKVFFLFPQQNSAFNSLL